jgi:hypothetical protein
MTARLVRISVFTVTTLALVAPARADLMSCLVDGAKAFAHSVARDTKRRNCWPEPFVAPDRYAVRSPLATMVENGWRRNNLLGDYHFVDEGGELTAAARTKVHWVLTEAPTHHRTIYVHRAYDAEVTAARVDSVQQYAAQVVQSGPLPLVLETDITARGWPAAQADLIGRRFEESTPDPRLPDAADGSASQ